MALTSMVNIYCPACYISSPRELRELVQARTYCTVCGATMNKSGVEAALASLTDPSAAGLDSIDGPPAEDLPKALRGE
jgi:hypothetical protein